jgi:hypothetical protein
LLFKEDDENEIISKAASLTTKVIITMMSHSDDDEGQGLKRSQEEPIIVKIYLMIYLTAEAIWSE